MDSPETFRNTVTTPTSTSTVRTISLSESSPVQEFPFYRLVNNISPRKAANSSSHLPRISSQRKTQVFRRFQLSQLETSQGDNGSKSFIDNPNNSKKSASLLPGKVITDTQKDLVIRNDRNTQLCGSSPCIDEYLVDPADVDCMYTVDSINTDVKQSNDAVETSQSDLIFHSSSENFEGSFLLFGESKGVDEPHKIGEKTGFGSLSKECEPEKQQYENTFDQLMQADLRHRGMDQRCLQFEVPASNAFGNINSSLLPVHTPDDSRAWPTCSDLKDLQASRTRVDMTSNKRNTVRLLEPVTSVTVSKPSGIGLHLNSVVNAMPLDRASSKAMEPAEVCMQEMKLASPICHKVENMNRCLISSSMDGQSSVGTEDERHETTAAIMAFSATPESRGTMDPSKLLDYVDHPAGVQYIRKPRPKQGGNCEEINRLSPKIKKKKKSVIRGDDGCTRCNCRKSKCLKLYCDCFASGIYCAEPCSCQDCYNRPEYEDTVLETKQQIESRNPLAFAPKIVRRATDFPLNNMEDDNLTTPSSTRHKRGCNCRRSMCLKKYCECYQANVGCSSECRCDGCKNSYGQKDYAKEHDLNKEGLSGRVEKISDKTFHNKQEMVANKTDLLRGKLFNMHRLSPLTPPLQCSDQGKEAAKSRVLTGKYLPSPDCDVTVFPPRANLAESLEDPERSCLLETNEMVGIKSYDWQLGCDNVETMDQSSLRCNSVNNVGQFTPLSNDPSMTWAASFPSKQREWAHLSQQAQKQSHGSTRLLSCGSLGWHSSPITPVTGLNEIKSLVCPEFDSSRLFDILGDETPETLKEASIPIKSVKASSPNQKRVSPLGSNTHELESSPSGGLRSGRKSILKPVPSFPPLTPCIDSRSTRDDNLGNGTSK